MKVLIDTNIILDIALNRKPFVEVLVTRNKADYGDRPDVLSPIELLERIKTA